VPGDPVVPVVPSKLLSELAMLLAYWRMAVPAAPPSDPRDRPTQAICGGLLLDHPVPAPGFRPVVGKAQQIERPPSSGGRGVPRLRVPWLAKVDQSSLLWVQAQAILAKSLRQHGQHPSRIFFLAEAQHTVVRIADQDCLA